CNDAAACHLGESDCPYVVPIAPEDEEAADAAWQVFRGLNRIATNTPAFLRVDWGERIAAPRARFPNGCSLGPLQRTRLPKDALFAAGGELLFPGINRPLARFLAMADHSVFINQMLIEPGTDNLELTYRIIEYLQGPNKRKKCIFVEDGKLVEEFDTLR